MFDHWLPVIAQLGLWAYVLLFAFSLAESIAVVGILVPGATFVVIFGFLVAQGFYNFENAVVFATIGAILGDILSFVLGRRGIDPAKRFPKLFSQATVDRAETFMLKYGVAGVFLGRFIGPLRPFIPFVAGALKMQWRRFMVMNILSAILWAISYLAIGFFFGQFWSSIHRGLRWVGVGMLVIIVIYIVWQLTRRRPKSVSEKKEDETLA